VHDDLARSIAALLSGADPPSAEQAADALWMARIIELGDRRAAPRTAGAGEPAPPGAAPGPGTTGGEPPRDGPGPAPAAPPQRRSPPAGAGRRRPAEETGPPAPPRPPDVPLHPLHPLARGGGRTAPPSAVPSASGTPARVVRVHREPALGDSLPVSRALRPLKQWVRAPGSPRLDEPATAAAIGETSLLLPSWLPRTERRFSVDLIVDTGPSMVIWRQLAAELRSLLEAHGAFRMVRAWSLESGGEQPRISPFRRTGGPGTKAPISPDRLTDPTGRRVTLLLTDGVGPLWHGAGIRAELDRWSRTRPVAVLQVLPRGLWHRTGLAPLPVLARPAQPGHAIPRYRGLGRPPGATGGGRHGGDRQSRDQHGGDGRGGDGYGGGRRGGWVPVLELDADWLGPWARLAAGSAAGWTPLFALPTGADAEQHEPGEGSFGDGGPGDGGPGEGGPREGEPSADGLGEDTPAEGQRRDGPARGEALLTGLDPAALVERFRSDASPGGFELAGYLAATPLVLPVMRLVQRAMMPHAKPVHLAEVFLSGLLTPVDDVTEPGGDPELRLYDFRPGVREVLLGTLTRQESLRTLDVVAQVSGRVAQRLGGTLNFRALIPDTASAGVWRLPEESLPFARVAASVLSGLGGEHRAAALALTRGIAAAGLGHSAAGQGRSAPGPVSLEKRAADTPSRGGARGTARRFAPAAPHRIMPIRPMLFVGLGGTGCRIGAELERRLRAELCGPDGMQLATDGRLPYQLPGYLQFVYADYNEPQLARLLHLGPTRGPAYSATAQVTHDLVPDIDSSPELTRLLRALMGNAVADWLPPSHDEPRVSPLLQGAGKLPTVARATLFAALRHGTSLVTAPLHRAVDAIGRSAGEPAEPGGGRLEGCDVFLAFSAAGGTGAGLFLDYLHLIDRVLRQKNLRGARIHPLVVMPSALAESGRGVRVADLNAARALADLSRLVDEQNAPEEQNALGDAPPLPAVRHPGEVPLRIRPGTVPTALLFSQPPGVRPAELPGVVASLVVSHVCAELTDATDHRQPLAAATLMGSPLRRAERPPSGIGRRGLSTGLVATLGTPVEELAEAFAGRLLASAVPAAGAEPAVNAGHVQQMFALSGLGELWHREAPEVPGPFPPPRGATAIEEALHERLETMERLLGELERRLDLRAAALAQSFAPHTAAERMLESLDLFQLAGVVRGVPGAGDPVLSQGFLGMLRQRSQALPVRPPDVDRDPPAVPRIRRRRGGTVRARWGDDEVSAALTEQDRWYRWCASTLWHRAWNRHGPRWRPAADDLDRLVTGLTQTLRRHAREEPRAFADRLADLYARRGGTVPLLPREAELPPLYERVAGEMAMRRALGPQRRRQVFATARRDPSAAVAEAKAALREEVQRSLTEGSSPLLPGVRAMLADAARSETVTPGQRGPYDRLAGQLAGLLPAGFEPPGGGPLRIMVCYPAVPEQEAAERYLRRNLKLPQDPARTVVYQPGSRDCVTVLMFRSGMGLGEVPDARRALRQWAQAQDREHPGDLLRWRQRVGYDDPWLLSTPGDRMRILHRLLCAMWNGQVDTAGDDASPQRVRIRLAGHADDFVPALVLELGGRGGNGWGDNGRGDGVSSWPGLLRAYERWALLGEESGSAAQRRHLMRLLPYSLAAPGRPPAALYHRFVHEVAPHQLALLAERERHQGGHGPWVRALHEFWAQTLPGALDLPFDQGPWDVTTLRDLETLGPGRRA
jgi:Tubulin like